MSKPTLFESTTCGRCGGSGHYSYNQINGSTCFGCGGSGLALTKRGRAAQASLIESQLRPASENAVGEFVWYDAYPFGRTRGWCKVEAIRPDTLNPGHLYLDLSRGGVKVVTYGYPGAARIRSIRDEAHRAATVAAALALQASLNKAGKPAKAAKATAQSTTV
jgi:hypothetical protein